MDITANDYQKQAARTANDTDYTSILVNCALGLAGESGEFADHIKKWRFHGHGLDTDKLLKEVGDVMWYCSRVCTALGVDLSDVMQANIDKLWKRYPNGFNSADSKARVDTQTANYQDGHIHFGEIFMPSCPGCQKELAQHEQQ